MSLPAIVVTATAFSLTATDRAAPPLEVITGASLTPATLNRMVLATGSVFWPPLSVPPLSTTLKAKLP